MKGKLIKGEVYRWAQVSIGGYMGIQVGIAVRVGIGGYREYISRSCLPLPTHRAPIVIVLVIIMMVGKVVSDQMLYMCFFGGRS